MSKTTLPKNVTEMSMEKHKANCFAVRKASRGYHVRQYISWGQKPGRTKKQARELAIKRKDEMIGIIENPRSWRMGGLTRKAIGALNDRGFVVDLPTALRPKG